MKPLKEDPQLRSISLSYSVALQALKPKSSPPRRRGLDASNDRGLTERRGEVFLLDILSHRMRVTGIFPQPPLRDRTVTLELWHPLTYVGARFLLQRPLPTLLHSFDLT